MVPNTLDMALQPCKEVSIDVYKRLIFPVLLIELFSQARAIIKAEEPFFLLHANDEWTQLTGCTQVIAYEIISFLTLYNAGVQL